MFRVYDKKKKRWYYAGFCLSQNGDLYQIKKTAFGNYKATLVPDNRYVEHEFIDNYDKFNNPLYEGDICEFEEAGIKGFISYSVKNASYVLFDSDSFKYYDLYSTIFEHLIKIGNVIDNPELIQIDA